MKKLNIFTILVIIAAIGAGVRLFDLSSTVIPASVAQNAGDAPSLKDVADAPPPITAAEADAPVPAVPPSAIAGDRVFSAAELEVLQSLSSRREELDNRATELARREALLKAAEGEVDRKIAELNKLKAELEALLGQQQTAQNAHVDSLVKIYESMKPKEAARIFDTLDIDVLLPVISRMNERRSSPILANMSPEKARLVTVKLAERQKLPAAPTPKKTP